MNSAFLFMTLTVKSQIILWDSILVIHHILTTLLYSSTNDQFGHLTPQGYFTSTFHIWKLNP